MPKKIFDQERPTSAMARRLDEAFAGCDEWTPAPPSRRRDDPEIAPWLSQTTRPTSHRTAEPESRAA